MNTKSWFKGKKLSIKPLTGGIKVLQLITISQGMYLDLLSNRPLKSKHS